MREGGAGVALGGASGAGEVASDEGLQLELEAEAEAKAEVEAEAEAKAGGQAAGVQKDCGACGLGGGEQVAQGGAQDGVDIGPADAGAAGAPQRGALVELLAGPVARCRELQPGERFVLGRAHAREAGLTGMPLAHVAREQVRVAADDCGAVRIEQQGATASGVIESGGGVHALRRGEATTLRAGDALALLASEPEATRVLRVLGDSASDPTNTTPAALPEGIGSKRRAGSEAAGGGVRAAKARKASEVVIELTDSSNDEGGKKEAASADSAQGGAMLLLVGLPGAGKSTVAKELVGRGTCAGLDVTRVCQDVLKKREACIRAAHNVVRAGGLAVVDRTHYDGEQRGHFVKLAARMGCPVAALTLTAPAAVCGARASSRSSHEGGLTGGKAYGVVNRLAGRWGAVNAATEGFHAARKVHELATVQDAVEAAAAVVAEARERHSRRLSMVAPP